MKPLVLVAAVAMPVVAWFSQRGAFGPDNGTISNQYPTLLVAAGYTFAVWGLIFLLDVLFGVWQLRTDSPALRRARPAAAAGFALTAAWMPIFSQRLFPLALLVIWGALGALLYAAVAMAKEPLPGRVPVALHAGWLSLAAFLNTAQVLVAYELLPTDRMLPWSLALFAVAGGVLAWANRRMGGSLAYVSVALWGLVGVAVKQSGAPLPGADTAAAVALGIGLLLLVQTAVLRAPGARR